MIFYGNQPTRAVENDPNITGTETSTGQLIEKHIQDLSTSVNDIFKYDQIKLEPVEIVDSVEHACVSLERSIRGNNGYFVQ